MFEIPAIKTIKRNSICGGHRCSCALCASRRAMCVYYTIFHVLYLFFSLSRVRVVLSIYALNRP